jgi:very-short-patch-repair endonuclease
MPNKIIPYNPRLKEFARKLRKQEILSEVLIWKQIQRKNLGVEFHRQVPLDEYIVDFYCHELMLAIEIDGTSHDDYEEVKVKDERRQKRLESLGVRFIRFHDHEVKRNVSLVVNAIVSEIEVLQKG